MVSRAVMGVLGLILVAGAGLYVYLPNSPFFQSSHLSFHFAGGSAVYRADTGQTNVTLTIINSGTVLVRLGGEQGVAPPAGYEYVVGSFHAYFYDNNGTQIYGGSGNPPITTQGGKIIATYLMTGAKPGDTFQITSTVTANGMTVSQSITLTVSECQAGTPGCQSSTTTSSTSSTTTSAMSNSTTSSTSLTSTTNSTTVTTTSSVTSTTSSSTSSSSSSSSTSTTTSTTSSSTICSVGSPVPQSGILPANGTLAFVIGKASGVYNPTTHRTLITVIVNVTGSLPIKLGGISGVPPPPGTSYICNSFTRQFYSANGTNITGDAQPPQPPQTQNGGWIIVSYYVVGAQPGEYLTETVSFTENGQTVTASNTFLVSP